MVDFFLVCDRQLYLRVLPGQSIKTLNHPFVPNQIASFPNSLWLTKGYANM